MNSYVMKRIFIGFILIIIGILFLGSQLGLITLDPSEIISTYWPVLLIIFGISGLFQHKSSGGSYMWSLFLIALGVGFLARNLDILVMSTGEYIKLLIPAFIILFGIKMMFGKEQSPKKGHDDKNKYEYNYDYQAPVNNGGPAQEPSYYSPPMQEPIPTNYKHSHNSDYTNHGTKGNLSGFFGDLYLGQDYWELKPMNISHFIGDTIIDLTKAQIPTGDTKLNISAFIGDVKVFVPNDLDVEISVVSSSFLGDSTVFNKRESGFMRSVKEQSSEFSLSDKKIHLQVNLFIGDITVQRVG